MLPIQIDSREFELLYYNITSKNDMPCSITMAGIETKSGNTCLSYALARRMAASGHKTLLIDLNTENSELSDQFSRKRAKWTPSDFQERAPIEKLGETGLYVMSAPSEATVLWPFREKYLLSKMIQELEKKFDCIIIDVPSLLKKSTEDADISSEVISSVTNITLLSILSGRTTENDIIRATDLLKKSGAKIHGLIMNDQNSPTLKEEICRELDRIKKWFPNTVSLLKKKVCESVFLSQEV